MGPVAVLRQHQGTGGARLIGLGAYQPVEAISSEQVARRFGRTGDWVLARTGIASRRTAATGQTVLDLAVLAGERALADAGLDAASVDLVVVASCSSSARPGFGLAEQVALALGTSTAAAFDLNAACAGFCYALAVAADAIRMGSARHVLLVGAEKMTSWVDPADLGTSIIFGDGAGAAVLGPAQSPGIGPVSWGSDGSGADLIHVPPGERTMRMEGRAVFRWATTEIHPVALDACELAGVAPSELAAIVPHQANLRIVDALADKLGAPNAVVARDIVDSGNTSAASIPIALTRLIEQGAVGPDAPALLVGFGAGLTYAAQVVRTPAAVPATVSTG